MADKIVNQVLGRDALPVPETMVDQGDTTYARKVAIVGAGGVAPASVALPSYSTLQNAVVASANGATLDVSGKNVAIFDIAGTFVGTISFETLQADGTTWVSLNALQIGTGVVAATATAPGLFRANVGGLDTVRARVTWTSGTSVTVKARALLIDDSVKSLTNPVGLAMAMLGGIHGTELRHRTAVTAIDCLLPPAVPTATAVTEAGSTLANVAYHFAVAAANAQGATTATVDGGAVTPTANQALRIAITQVAGATFYDIFLSTAAAPLYVGRISEAQRATGDQIISAVGVVSARAGATVAGTIDVGIVGTGVASTAAPFAANIALIVPPAGVTPISSLGYNTLWFYAKLTVTDFRVVPLFTVRLFASSDLSPNDWFSIGSSAIAPLSGVNAGGLLQLLTTVPSQGIGQVVAVVTLLQGTGASLDIWVHPS